MNSKQKANYKFSSKDNQSKSRGKKLFLGATNSHTSKKSNTNININRIDKKTLDSDKKNENEEIKNNNEKKELAISDQMINRDKVLHENNLKVIKELEKQLNELDKENNILIKDLNSLKNLEESEDDELNEVKEEIENEKRELENLKVENDTKNREYLHLLHLKHQQERDAEDENRNREQQRENNSSNNNNSGNLGEIFNGFTLGEVMNTLLPMLRIQREQENSNSGNESNNNLNNDDSIINNDEGMTYGQIESLPSSKYTKNNNTTDKCIICGFLFCYNDFIISLSRCHHVFHKACLTDYLFQRQSSKCPICKVSLT